MKKANLSIILAIVTILFQGKLYSQENNEFKPSAQPILKVFSNYNYNIDESTSAFEITRARLGYKYKFSETLSSTVYFETCNPNAGDYEYLIYLKNASLTYEKNKLNFEFGLLATQLTKVQEELGKHRYIEKSFADLYKLGTTGDFGAQLNYKITKNISLDYAVLNGEGYKINQADYTYKTAFGLTLKTTKGFVLRGYSDISIKDYTETNLIGVIGYKNEKISLGADYNYKFNKDYIKEKTIQGVSGYFSYDLNKKYQLYARYDNVFSNTLSGATDNWNLSKDGEYLNCGLQFSPNKNIKISPNYQGWISDKDKKLISSAFISLEITY